ncbi:choline transporter [Ciborinia camelliae]|nr:choline transporter [Ciborinia camelliae]
MDIPKFYDISSPNATIYEQDNIPNATIQDEDVNNHDMRRKFTLWSILGEGFSLTNSWFGISSAFITGIDSGGPALFVYGIPLVALVSICIGSSLSELASAMPNAAGQHFWAMELAPKKYARPLSYVTGYCAWAGSLFASASVSLAVASAAVGCWQLNHTDFVIRGWHVFIAYQVTNLFAFLFNCYGKILPTLGTITLYTSLISFAVILFAVPMQAPSHQDIKFVFATFINNTGWPNNGIAFIVGLVNTNWAFACLDSVVHLSEEVRQPEIVIPISIMATIVIGLTTAWFFVVAMLFSLNNFETIVGTLTGVPILELFYQAVGNKFAAILLEFLIMATGIGCLIACHTWQSRLCWTFARDGGVPFHKSLAKINVKLDVPLRAHAMSSTLALIGSREAGYSIDTKSMRDHE